MRFAAKWDSDSESFHDAPADRKASGQLKLASYAKKMPGRLASRMLRKMVQESAHGSAGAVANDPDPTPPAAVHYLLTVMLPQLGTKANLRTQRELRNICTAIAGACRGPAVTAGQGVAEGIAGRSLGISPVSGADEPRGSDTVGQSGGGLQVEPVPPGAKAEVLRPPSKDSEAGRSGRPKTASLQNSSTTATMRVNRFRMQVTCFQH